MALKGVIIYAVINDDKMRVYMSTVTNW